MSVIRWIFFDDHLHAPSANKSSLFKAFNSSIPPCTFLPFRLGPQHLCFHFFLYIIINTEAVCIMSSSLKHTHFTLETAFWQLKYFSNRLRIGVDNGNKSCQFSEELQTVGNFEIANNFGGDTPLYIIRNWVLIRNTYLLNKLFGRWQMLVTASITLSMCLIRIFSVL